MLGPVQLWNPRDCSPPGSSVHGVSQASRPEWVTISFSRGSSRPRDWTCVSCISCTGRQILYREHHLGSPRCINRKTRLISLPSLSRSNLAGKRCTHALIVGRVCLVLGKSFSQHALTNSIYFTVGATSEIDTKQESMFFSISSFRDSDRRKFYCSDFVTL